MSDMDIIDISPQNSMTSGSMVRELATAEIDQQISTAHAYPRSITRVNRNIISLVTLDQDFAKECTFALPRGNKPITGPSIRMAEVVFSQWGNCRGGARVVHVDRKEMFIEAEGVFHDLETNAATTKRVRRRISDKNGKLLSDDMIIVTGNAACSIAFRNAVLAGVPKMVWGPAYDNALRMIKGDVKTLPERRTAAMTAMAAFGLKPEQVFALLGVNGMDDIGLDQIVIIGGMHNAMKNEEVTVEELLASAQASTAAPARVAGSISQRATATGPGQANTTQVDAKMTNPAADAALEAEAKRVAEKRAADAKAKAEADAKAKTAKADEEAAKAAQDKADRQAAAEQRYAEDRAEAQKQHEEDLAQRAAETTQEEADADQVQDDDTGGIATDPASLEGYYDAILADLLDDMPADVAQSTHAEKIAAIQVNNPTLYDQLMGEINAA